MTSIKGLRRSWSPIAVFVLLIWGPVTYWGEAPTVETSMTSDAETSSVAAGSALEYIGSESCSACHDSHEPALAATAHGSEAFAARSEHGCETCHGPASAHLDDPEAPYGASLWTAKQSSDMCLSCHTDDHSRFPTNAHARAGLGCVDCHSIHGQSGWTALDEVSADPRPTPFTTARITGSSLACVECHSDVAGEFQFNERHRLQEGIIGCADCHDPHGPSPRTRLAAFKQESCVDCHADKGGPFVFEHGSVRVEGCAACHSPHGSPNRHMLTHQRVAELCYSCHVEVPGFHIFGGRFGLDTQCTNCHATIHGSNFSPVFFK